MAKLEIGMKFGKIFVYNIEGHSVAAEGITIWARKGEWSRSYAIETKYYSFKWAEKIRKRIRKERYKWICKERKEKSLRRKAQADVKRFNEREMYGRDVG